MAVKTCLWFERDGEAAAAFYVSLLPNSRIERVLRAPDDYPGGRRGEALVVDFVLDGQGYQALNGGSRESYGMAASISAEFERQEDLDRVWAAFLEAGGAAIQCGWLRDRWGVPWQIVPASLPRLLADPDPAVARRVFAAMQEMVKLDGPALEAAARGP